jgi:hypothetical protein
LLDGGQVELATIVLADVDGQDQQLIAIGIYQRRQVFCDHFVAVTASWREE